MPYDQKYKIGDGFNIQDAQSKGSPFYLPAIQQNPPQSVEGQDGIIKTKVATSQSELAESIAVEASAWGSGWGVSAKASFQYSNNMKMSSNEVILIATHVIDRGKSYIDPSNFIFTKSAKKLLATNAEKFKKEFGTHFLAGCTTECSMQVYFRRTGTSSEDKKEIAAQMEAEYSGLTFSGGVSASADYQTSSSNQNQNTRIEIKYLGANNDAFVQGLSIQQLKQAILDFPQHCTGNIAKYILWPYENCQNYLEINDEVDLILKEKRIQNEKELLEKQSIDEFQKDAEYQKYLNQINEEVKQKEIENQQKLQNAKNFKESLTLLDEIFATAILKNKISRVTLQDQVPLNEETRKQQETEIYQLKQNELILNNEYDIYRKQLENLVDANVSLSKQLELIDQAKDYLEGNLESHPESGNLKKIGEVECEDKDCFQCERYNPKICLKCKQDFSLTVESACVLQCPEGQFSQLQNEILTCVECHPSCKACENEGINCVSCYDGKFLEESKCVKKCSQGYYVKEPNCLHCSGEWHCLTQNKCECNSCAKGLEMHHQKCYSTCQSAQYRNLATLQCIDCASPCLECYGSKSSECTKCKSGFVLQETTCQSSCGNQWVNQGDGICKQCPNIPNCIQCILNYQFYIEKDNVACQCIKCNPQYYTKQDFNQCLKKFSSCPAYQYFTGYWQCAHCSPNTPLVLEGRSRCAGCIQIQGIARHHRILYETFCVDPGQESKDFINNGPLKHETTYYFQIGRGTKILINYTNGQEETISNNPNELYTYVDRRKLDRIIQSVRVYDESTILYNQLNKQ